MLNVLYNLFIFPIELLVEIIYRGMYRLLNDYGAAVIGVSLVIQTLILPLYKKADAMQDQERERQKKMSRWVRHIRATFKGDERVMMLQTYYRQQNYKSWYPLRSSVSILLQVPFFIAAYHYLSTTHTLRGADFLFIRDLSLPDRTLVIAGLPVNILPIAMTAFNIVSGAIYTRGLERRDKVQVYALAAVFLVLLYNSPAGLVLYWTMNNLYSLMKNVCMKLLAGRLKSVRGFELRRRRPAGTGYEAVRKAAGGKGSLRLCAAEALFLTIFMGGIIPLNVLSASPSEFIEETYGPLDILWNNLTVYAGIFLVWGMIMAAFMKDRTRHVLSVIGFVLTGIFVIDYMAFGNDLGNMSPLLIYDTELSFSAGEIWANIGVICAAAAVLTLLAVKCAVVMRRIVQILAVSAALLLVINGRPLKQQADAMAAAMAKNTGAEETEAGTDGAGAQKVLTLSRNGQNVVVFMLDRAISGYIPYLFDEKPELQEAFAGFTYYPNTLSFGGYTNFGAPALFGGYEYMPSEINKRVDETLADKHDEALCVLPRLFSENGYQVTVCDPPYAGSYLWYPDLSIYDTLENVNACLLNGAYMDPVYQENNNAIYPARQREAFIYYSMMKVAPVVAQKSMYAEGDYWMIGDRPISEDFLSEYCALLALPEITDVTEDGGKNLLVLQNSTTHEPQLLKVPEYVPDAEVGITYERETRTVGGHTLKIENREQAAHYQCNMAAMMALADWFAFMKENGCWDNTRIILVSDHGRCLGDFPDMVIGGGLDLEGYNPLLMVKDFNASAYTEDDTFMTQADVPTLATEGVIEPAVNPYTGSRITDDAKKGPLYVTTSDYFDTRYNRGNVFNTSDAPWYEVTGDNIFDERNWRQTEEK